ncbi:MAG TPA: hypothetical protein VF143_10360 [Candidatus Nanopelagicales bacterium]
MTTDPAAEAGADQRLRWSVTASRPGQPQGEVRGRGVALLRWGFAGVAVGLVAWLSYTRGGWVPFLSGVDLGVHEFGHLLFAWAPFLVVALAGSALQVAAPAALAGYFAWRGDRLGASLLVGWLGMSLHNVAVYLGDAERMVLPLFGDDGSGAGHDWHNVLGALGWLERTDAIAGFVTALSVLAFLAALGLIGWWAWRDLRPGPAWQLPVRVRQPGPTGRRAAPGAPPLGGA